MRAWDVVGRLGLAITVVAASTETFGQGRPVDVDGTMTFRCVIGNSCPTGDAMVSDAHGAYAKDASQDTFVYLSKDGLLQFRLSNESGSRSLYMNLATPDEVLCSRGGAHCYIDEIAGWTSTFGRDGGQSTIVTASGADVKNGLYSLAIGGTAVGRFVVSWDDGLRDMRWGLTFRGSDQTLRIRRDHACQWTIAAGAAGTPATAVLSAWPKIRRAYTEVPQALYDVPFSLTVSTCTTP